MQHAVLQQNLHDLGNAAGPVKIGGDEPSGGLEVTEYRNSRPYALEIIELQRHPRCSCDGEQMQNRVGGATDRHRDRDPVLEGPAGEDLPREPLGGDRLHQRRGGCRGAVCLFRIFGRHRRGIGQAHAHGFEHRGHGVGREHPAAGALSGAGAAFHLQQLAVTDLPCAVLPHGFERAHDGEVASLVVAWLDGAAVDEDAGNVHAGHRDHGAGHVLVAPADGDQTIHALGAAGGLDRIGDDLAGNQRVFHPLGAHRDAVAHGDRSEELWHPAGITDRCFGSTREGIKTGIARRDGAVRAGDADDGFAEVAIAKANGAEHGPVRRTLHAFGDGAALQFVGHE